MPEISESIAAATKLRTTHSQPACAVYFVDKSWRVQDTFAESQGLIVPEIGDILNVRTNISRSSIGTFSITLNNKDGRYLVNDSIQESVQTLKENFDQRATKGGEQTSEERTQIRESAYPHTSARDWLQQENVNDTITVEGRQYVVSLEKNKNTGASEWVYYKTSGRGDTFIRTLAPAEFFNENVRKRRYNQDFYTKYEGSLKKTRPIFEPMMRVVILMSARFPTSPKDMLTVFTGLVDSVTDNYSEGNETLIIAGRDVLKWLEISQININPALVSGVFPDSGAESLQIYENTFAGKQGWQIISYLIFGGELESGGRRITGLSEFEVRTSSDAGAAGLYTGTNVKKTFIRVGKEQYLTASGESVDSVSELFKKSRVHLQVQDIDKASATDGKVASSPIRKYTNSFTTYQALAEYRSRLDICREVARWTNYEFYADQNGDIWFHQPRYANHWITNADNPDAFVIREEDIQNSSFSESDEAIYTSVLVTGQMDYIQDLPLQEYEYRHLEEERTLISKYGRRFVEETSPYLHSNEDCRRYAKAILQRRNAERRTGTVTVPLRPELRVAYPVYISNKNDIYYVNSVEHSFVWGQQATTTINLTYGRKPWELLPEVLDYGSTSIIIAQQTGIEGGDDFLAGAQTQDPANTVLPENKFLLGPLSGEFRLEQDFVDAQHFGIDLGTLFGSPVYSVQDGVVFSIGLTSGAYTIVLSHGQTLQTVYRYLDPSNPARLQVGQKVIAGGLIGRIGLGIEKGTSESHLHFEVKQRRSIGGDFKAADPKLFLPAGYLKDIR